jgi:hypothetical protein
MKLEIGIEEIIGSSKGWYDEEEEDFIGPDGYQKTNDLLYGNELDEMTMEYIVKKVQEKYGDDFIFGGMSGGLKLDIIVDSIVNTETDEEIDI